MKKSIAAISALTLALSLSVFIPVVSADSEAVTYSYLIGTGFLCDLDPSACPAIAMASNGDTVEITGTGTLTTHPKSVTGEGTFTHKDSTGEVLVSGTWTAEKLISFDGYGCIEGGVCGGRAIMEVTLWVEGTPVAKGVLQVDCIIGDMIPAGAVEGIRLNVKDLLNFNKEVSGFTVFVDSE